MRNTKAKAKDYVAMSGHSADFFKKHGIGFEGNINKLEKLENWNEIKPFFKTEHLPFNGVRGPLNIASYNDKEREEDIK